MTKVPPQQHVLHLHCLLCKIPWVHRYRRYVHRVCWDGVTGQGMQTVRRAAGLVLSIPRGIAHTVQAGASGVKHLACNCAPS